MLACFDPLGPNRCGQIRRRPAVDPVTGPSQCTMSKEQYFDVLRENGLLPAKKEETPKSDKEKAKKK